MACLAAVLENRGTEIANLDNCQRSLEAIQEMQKRSGVAGAEAAEEAEALPSFDHSRCADCSYSYSITCDCTNHMAALQQQGVDANQRLQQLVEMREKLTEISDEFAAAAAQDSGSGGGSSHGSPDEGGDASGSGSYRSSFSSYACSSSTQQHGRGSYGLPCEGDYCVLPPPEAGSAGDPSAAGSGSRRGIAEQELDSSPSSASSAAAATADKLGGADPPLGVGKGTVGTAATATSSTAPDSSSSGSSNSCTNNSALRGNEDENLEGEALFN